MNRHLKRLICGALLAGVMTLAAAQSFPSQRITIVCTSSAGGLLDMTTRLVAQRMSEDLGQPVVVENRAGAEGLIAIRAVKGAPANGYTLLSTGTSFTQQLALKLDPGYDFGDFVGVGMMGETPLIMAGYAHQNAKDLIEFVARAKAEPGRVSVGHGATSGRMAAMILAKQAGVELTLVPFKSASASIPDAVAGRVDAVFDGGSSIGPQIASGRLRAFAITSAQRSPAFPSIPTFAEQGLPKYRLSIYLGLLAPANTPKSVVQRLGQALQKALASREVRKALGDGGVDMPSTKSPEEFTDFLQTDLREFTRFSAEMAFKKE